LEEAPAGPLKIVMDATDLKFLDSAFDTATAFATGDSAAPQRDPIGAYDQEMP